MSSQPTPTITVQDPQNSPLRLGETPLARTLKDSQVQEERDSRLGKNLIVPRQESSGAITFFQGVGGGTAPYKWGASRGQFEGFKYLPSLNTLKLNNLFEFRLTVSINAFLSDNQNIFPLPASNFTCPVSFIIATIDNLNNFPISSSRKETNFCSFSFYKKDEKGNAIGNYGIQYSKEKNLFASSINQKFTSENLNLNFEQAKSFILSVK